VPCVDGTAVVTGHLREVPAYTDERGTLVPVELTEVDFDVRRVFVVTGLPGGSRRGGHRLTCRELIVLAGGCALVEVGPGRDGPFEASRLAAPGDAIEVGPEGWLRYSLADATSVLLVLADRPYEDPEQDRRR
jgi:hypothetical protein